MRLASIVAVSIAFLSLWFLCATRHWSEIESLAGIRNAPSGQPSPGPAPSPTPQPIALRAALTGEKLALAGTVPTREAKDALLSEARRLYGDENIIDALNVRDGGANPPLGWLPGALSLLPLARTAGFTIGERQAKLTGYVPTDKVRSDTLALARTTLGEGWTVTDRLHIGAAPPAGSATGI